MNYFWILERITSGGHVLYLSSKLSGKTFISLSNNVSLTTTVFEAFHFDTEEEAEDFLSDIITITPIDERSFILDMKAKHHATGD